MTVLLKSRPNSNNIYIRFLINKSVQGGPLRMALEVAVHWAISQKMLVVKTCGKKVIKINQEKLQENIFKFPIRPREGMTTSQIINIIVKICLREG